MPDEVEAFVSNGGEGVKVTVTIPAPGMRAWITPDDARVLAAKLLRAANIADANRQKEENDLDKIPF